MTEKGEVDRVLGEVSHLLLDHLCDLADALHEKGVDFFPASVLVVPARCEHEFQRMADWLMENMAALFGGVVRATVVTETLLTVVVFVPTRKEAMKRAVCELKPAKLRYPSNQLWL